MALFILALIFTGGVRFLWTYHGPTPPTEIYRGIVYSCRRLPEGPQSGGLLHLIRADLNVPGVSLYITPMDPLALAHGWRYRLQYVPSVVHDENLAAAVNGTLFNSDSNLIRLPGDFATGSETLVANHVVDHIDPNTYLLWWDDDMNSHFQSTKPPSPEVLARAKWAIGGQGPILLDGKMNPNAAGTEPDRRTMIAIDPDRRLVWIAAFDRASGRFAAQTLADEGAQFGVTVDGGTSTAMAIGPDGKGVRPGVVAGNWRPVANVFGFRAQKIE
jgi:phosphodiester glycosidase